MRIYELSKKLSVTNKEIIAKLAGMSIEVKSHMANIDDDIAEKLTSIFLKPEKPTIEEKPAVKKTKDRAAIEPRSEKAVKPSAEAIITEVKEPSQKEPVVLPKSVETPVIETDEIILPDRFKKEIDQTKISKFKAKPGMQRAFDSIRRVDVTKKAQDFRSHFKKHDKRPFAQKIESTPPPLTTQPRKRVLKFQEGSTVKEFAELIGQKVNEVIKKFITQTSTFTSIWY